MEDERRTRLARRRELLQLRLRRAEQSREFRAIAARLCVRDVRFSKLTPRGCMLALGRLVEGPGQDERMLWSHVRSATCCPWSTCDERDGLIRTALGSVALPSEPVAVIWHPSEAGLCIRADRLGEVLGEVFSGLGETTWLVAARGGAWLIEVSCVDREVCWAPAMASQD